MYITDTIKYIGADDHKIDLFEGHYHVPNGIAYNSYVILDEKIAVMDTIDRNFTDEWLEKLEAVLEGRKPDYLIVQHMEPDHSASIARFLEVYPDATLVGNAKTFTMIDNYFCLDPAVSRLAVKNGETLELGAHTLTFLFAPMVHWPEVMVTYDSTDKVLFSADGFGKFGANDVDEPWDDESRRYYIGIVGKYGPQVQKLLKAAAGLDIACICPLHGPVLKEDLGHYIDLYDKWSSYTPEEEGVLVAYTSVYGHTKEAALKFAELLKEKGCPKVITADLARCDMSQAVADAFRLSKVVLATTTYNADIFPYMREFIDNLTERSFQNRTVGIIENGSWAPTVIKTITAKLANSKNLTFAEHNVSIMSALNEASTASLEALAAELA